MPSNTEQGQRFIKSLLWLLGLLIAVYVVSHAMVHDRLSGCTQSGDCDGQLAGGQVSWHYFATLTPQGEVIPRHIDEMDWYVGSGRTVEILKSLTSRYETIKVLSAGVKAKIQLLAGRLALPDKTRELVDALDAGNYDRALQVLRFLQYSLSQDTLSDLDKTIGFSQLGEDLTTLGGLINQQRIEVTHLSPPLASLFFWTSPTLSMLEVLFWAAFGVITNLLVNSAEYLRKGDFQPCERWVAYTKLVYGPILAMVLVMALINGWFDVESYRLRVWTLPLLGFLFGYASRRTARQLDKLLERFMGKMEQGIAAGPEQARKRHQAIVKELQQAYKPATFTELKAQAKKLAKAHLENEVSGKGKGQ